MFDLTSSRRVGARWACTLLSLTLASRAAAELVTFTGYADNKYYDSAISAFVDAEATFSFETGASLQPGSTATQGIFVPVSFKVSLFLSTGTWTHTAMDPRMYVGNDTSDGFQFSSELNPSAPTLAGFPVPSYKLELTQYGGAIFSGVEPPSSLSLSDWHVANIVIYLDTGSRWFGVTMPLTSLTAVSAVPEPSTWALLSGVAALGLAVIRRRRATPRDRR